MEQILDTGLPVNERLQALLQLAQVGAAAYIEPLTSILNDEQENLDLRCSVALVLGKTAHEDAVAALAQQARHPDARLRNYCVQGLGLSQHMQAAPVMLESLLDSNNAVFASAAQGLGHFGNAVVPLLCELLANGPDDARCVAAWQLGELQDRRAIPTLLEQGRHNSNTDIQALCLWALGEIGVHSKEIMALLQWAIQVSEPEVRLRAETALKKIVRHVN